jgi:hypothetical protein
MDRIKKTVRELEKLIHAAQPNLKGVKFSVVAERSAGGWTTAVSGSQPNIAEVEIRLKQIADLLVALYELQE